MDRQRTDRAASRRATLIMFTIAAITIVAALAAFAIPMVFVD